MAAETTVLAPGLAERARVIGIIRAHQTQLFALGVKRLWLFGSLARGEANSASDVDVLIDVVPERRFSLLDLAEVRLTLCDLLGRDTGVVIRQDQRPQFRATIAVDLVEVF